MYPAQFSLQVWSRHYWRTLCCSPRKLGVSSHFACAFTTSLGADWKHFSFWRKATGSSIPCRGGGYCPVNLTTHWCQNSKLPAYMKAPYCSFEVHLEWLLHRCSEGCQCIVVVREIGQKPLSLPYASSLQPTTCHNPVLFLQFVCNQGNHSVVKTIILFCSVFKFLSNPFHFCVVNCIIVNHHLAIGRTW